MRGLLTNPYQYPGVPPSLNWRHPAISGKGARLVCVARAWGGMTDLLTGNTSTNTNTQGEINSLGPCIAPKPSTNGTVNYLPFPSPFAGEVMNNCTLALIFQPRGLNGGQGLIGTDASAGAYKIQTSLAGISFVASGTIKWSLPCVVGHNYFVAASLNHSLSSAAQCIVVNMTTGQVWTLLGTGVPSPTSGANYHVLSYVAATAPDQGRIAAAMISNNSLSLTQLLAWGADPWSLWYDTSAPNLMFSAGTVPAITPPPPTGGLLANPFSYTALATTNATSVSTRPTALTGWDMINTSAATKFVRLYNKAAAPVPASDAALIVARFPIPAGARVSAQLGTNSGWFSAGLAFDITGAQADTDATVTAAGDVTLNLFFE